MREMLKLLMLVLLLSNGVYYASAESKLSAPQNVKVTSINMGAVVEWSPPLNPNQNMTYTARYVFCSWGNISFLCMKTRELKCDAGVLPAAFGCYIFQVRAEYNGLFSKWVNSTRFRPNRDTIIGPPTVTLVIKNNSLDVSVQPPVLKIGIYSMFYFKITYAIKYWTEGYKDESIEKLISTSSDEDMRMRVKGLHFWSRYCVTAKVLPEGYISSLYSPPKCVSNIPVLLSCGVAAGVIFPLMILLSWLTCKVHQFLYPKPKLPELLKNLFSSSFWSGEAMHQPSKNKEQHDHICAVSEKLEKLCEDQSEESGSSEDEETGLVSDLDPLQQMDEEYKLLTHTRASAVVYPNQLYPLCLANCLFTESDPSVISLPSYYNTVLTNFEPQP